MSKTIALVLSLLLVPGLVVAQQQTAPAPADTPAPAPAAAPGDASAPAAAEPVAPADPNANAGATATNTDANVPADGTVMTIEGVLNVQMIGKPDITTADGKQYQLIGDKADEINKLQNGDGMRIKATGKFQASVGDDNLLVDSYELLDKGAAGVSTGAGADTAPAAPAPATQNTAPANP